MANIGQFLKEEINRLSRRQINTAIRPLRKELRAQRKTIAELREQCVVLARACSCSRPPQAEPPATEAPTDRCQKPWVTGKGVRAIRKRLGLTQQEFAKLIRGSAITVHKWERQPGKVGLRRKSMEAVLRARSLGAREAKRLLAGPAA